MTRFKVLCTTCNRTTIVGIRKTADDILRIVFDVDWMFSHQPKSEINLKCPDCDGSMLSYSPAPKEDYK